MRPGQNKRMRGRPNNNRRGPNPLTRSYESNGPDVKIRGNAHHVAEKYLQLARDAHTNGDPVAAENYLQHAEHYFRLIASAQAAQLQQQNGAARPPGEAEGEDLEDDDVNALSDRFASPAERAPQPYQQPGFAPVQPQPQPQPQPYQDRPAYDNDRQPSDRGYQGRPDRPHNNRPQDRGPRDNRPYQDRQDQNRDNRDSRDNRFPRDNRPRDMRPYRDAHPPRESSGSSEAGAPGSLPSFITAPTRANSAQDSDDGGYANRAAFSEAGQSTGADSPPVAPSQNEGMDSATRYPGRGRRRRPRPNFGYDAPQENRGSGEPEEPVHSDEAPAGD